ncbi:SCO family protein [Myxococcus fulvus]|nr:SCO family protein [Myxococcus fulvus]
MPRHLRAPALSTPPMNTRPRRRLLPVLAVCVSLGLLFVGAGPWLEARTLAAKARSLPDFGPLPHFELQDQEARAFTQAQLERRVVVADFFFTRCPTVCPLLTERMARLQRRAREQDVPVHFVSFSVDPRYDTPERLAAYARDHALDTANWSLVTGPLEQVETTVLNGFRVMMGRADEADEDDFLSLFHGEHFVLVDATGRLRGYYRVTEDPQGLEQLLEDASALAHAAH